MKSDFLRQHIWILRDPKAWSWVAQGILIVILGLLAWRMTMASRSSSLHMPVAQASDARAFAPYRPQVSGEQLAGRHLFGAVPVAATSAPVMAASAVHVIGIVSTNQATNSWAILDVNGNQQSYSVGNTLPDGETVVAVNPDRVTLDRNGDRYSVMLDMHLADTNARFDTFNVGTPNVGGFDSMESVATRPFTPPPSTEQSLQALRQQLIARRGLMQPPAGPLKLQAADDRRNVMVQQQDQKQP